MKLTGSMREFILHWGEMGTRWGVNRTVAQVHALLYLSPEALTAEEIAETLEVARSNVSTSLKELQHWTLVEAVHRMGERREHFRTSQDVWALFLTVVEQRVEREILPTLKMLRRCREAESGRPADAGIAGRIAAMEDFLNEVYGWYGEVKGLPVSTLRGLMRVGAGVTRFLPGARGGRRR